MRSAERAAGPRTASLQYLPPEQMWRPIARAASMEEAVRIARELALPGDAVLLSPACSSLDMFRSYAHRGEVFTRAVKDQEAAS